MYNSRPVLCGMTYNSDHLILFFLFVGVAKRKCLENGVWGYPDYGGCTNKEFNVLQEKVWLHYQLCAFGNRNLVNQNPIGLAS